MCAPGQLRPRGNNNKKEKRGRLAVVGLPLILLTKGEVKVEKTNPLEGGDVGGAEDEGGSEEERGGDVVEGEEVLKLVEKMTLI